MGWVVRMGMVERIVRHLTDFRPFPDGRIADACIRRGSEGAEPRPTVEANTTTAPKPRVCVGVPSPTAIPRPPRWITQARGAKRSHGDNRRRPKRLINTKARVKGRACDEGFHNRTGRQDL
jgi:hypothetical protein